MNAPNYVNIDLSQNDVRDNIQKIFDDMTRIRQEARVKAADDVIKDEYMHLTYRLASSIESTASDKDMGRMQKIVRNIDDGLLHYDPSHDGYWIKKNKSVVTGLEDMLIGLRGDRFCGIDEKYHVFQALKFLGAKNEEDKQSIYNSITPTSSKNVSFEQSGLLKSLAFFFGKNYDLEIQEDTVRVNGVHRSIDSKLFSMVENLGFSNVVTTEWKDYPAVDSYELISKNPLESFTNKKDVSIAKLVKNTAPISYNILGMLPQSLRESLGERWKFNSSHAYAANAWTEFVAGAAIAIAGAYSNNPSLWVPGVFVGGQALVRGMCWLNDNYVGNVLATLVTLPFRKSIKRENSYFECKYRLNPKVKDVSLDTSIGAFEEAANLELSDKAKESLVYAPENNQFTFGRGFDAYSQKHIKGLKPFEKDRDNSRTYTFDIKLIDDYTKAHFLIYSPENTYLITRISADPIHQKFIEQFDLKKNDAIKDIAKDSVYTRMRSFSSGKLTSDLEVTP